MDKLNLLKSIAILCFLLCSCNNKKQESYVFYFNGINEMHRRLSLEELEQLCTKLPCNDTIYIVEKTETLLENKIHANALPNDTNTNDIVLYVHTADIDLFLNRSSNNCWIRKGGGRYEYARISEDVSYMLKCMSGYYNKMPLEDIQHDIDIKANGVPEDYKYYHTDMTQKKQEYTKSLLMFMRRKCALCPDL